MSSSNDQYMNDDRFDGLYLNVASQAKGIEPLLDTVFSFLRRKTDFFKGPPVTNNDNDDIGQPSQIAIDKVNEVLMKHAKLYAQDQLTKQQKQQQQQKKKDSKKKDTTTTTKVTAAVVSKQQQQPDVDVIEMNNDGGFDVSNNNTLKQPPVTTSTVEEVVVTDSTTTLETPGTTTDASTAAAAPVTNDEDDEDEDTTKKETVRGPPPLGNGGTVPGKYSWTQILSEVIVTVPLPPNTRGRDLQVVMNKQHLLVTLRNPPPPGDVSFPNSTIIDDTLCKPIICDDSFWTVEDNSSLVLTLQKLNTMEWWDCICVHDPNKIDIKCIQPENSSLHDLDGETRQTVEKMMYDQKQKAMGKPTSDEEQKLSMLEKFKLQHPELDFSNAKIS